MTDALQAYGGTKTLLFGAPGAGKTYSIGSLVEAGLEVFVIFTEDGRADLMDSLAARNLPLDKVHWRYIPAAQTPWASMRKSAGMINRLSLSALREQPNIERKSYTQYLSIIDEMMDFTDERTGKNFGNVSEWGVDRVLVLDSLSGLNQMVLDLVTGAKPVRTQPEWGTAIEQEERFLHNLTLGCTCHFVCTAHIIRDKDDVSGLVTLLPNALGSKLPPRVGQFFTDVVLAYKEGDEWFWSTQVKKDKDTSLKTRNLDWSPTLEPSFVPLIHRWNEKISTLNEGNQS